MLCGVVWRYARCCDVMRCYVVLCCALRCNAIRCYVVLCYAMISDVMTCYVIILDLLCIAVRENFPETGEIKGGYEYNLFYLQILRNIKVWFIFISGIKIGCQRKPFETTYMIRFLFQESNGPPPGP